jgi:hypothetical protein
MRALTLLLLYKLFNTCNMYDTCRDFFNLLIAKKKSCRRSEVLTAVDIWTSVRYDAMWTYR